MQSNFETNEPDPHRNGTHPSGSVGGAAIDVRSRIGELRQLQDGWLDGIGIAPDEYGLNWLADQFDSPGASKLPRPYLFPTPEGRVLAEWSCRPWSMSLDVDLVTRIGRWHALDLETDAEETADLDMNKPESWEQLAEWIGGREPVTA